MQGHMDVKIV